MADGQYGNANVPKKALASQDIIYQATTLLSVAERAGIPNVLYDELTVKDDVVRGIKGEYDVDMTGDIKPKRLSYTQIISYMKWSEYPYDILDKAKLDARNETALWQNAQRSSAEYFAAVRDYQVLNTLSDAAENSAAATATWGSAGADPELDVVSGLSKIAETSNSQAGEKISVVVPAKVFFEVNKLTLINNIQRTIKDYLQGSFELEIHAFRPPKDGEGTAYLDGLTTTALSFVQGEKTAKSYTYDPSVAASKGVPLLEHSRVAGRGDTYLQKMASTCMPVWDGLGTWTSATSYKTNRVYKITGVTS